MQLILYLKDTATTEIYTLALHDALPISQRRRGERFAADGAVGADARRQQHRQARPLGGERDRARGLEDRKSTRLNSSHANISYAVFCLKKKLLEAIGVRLQYAKRKLIPT